MTSMDGEKGPKYRKKNKKGHVCLELNKNTQIQRCLHVTLVTRLALGKFGV